MWNEASLPEDVRTEIQTVTLPGHHDAPRPDLPVGPMFRFWKPYRFGMSPLRLRPITDD